MRKILLLLFVPVFATAQKDHAKLLQEYMTGQNKYFQFNGAILVAEKGKPIYQQSLGYADYNTKRMLNDSSVFELASVSKQFTAMGIMILKEKGLGLQFNIRCACTMTIKFSILFYELPGNTGIIFSHIIIKYSGIDLYFFMFIWHHKWFIVKNGFNSCPKKRKI